MRLVCKYKKNADLPDAVRLNDDLLTAEYDLVVGTEYDVFGQAVFNKMLIYLVDPQDDCRPNWYPAELFQVTDNRLPVTWRFAYYADEYRRYLGAIWGYTDLITDPDHFDRLAERDASALNTFARHKRLHVSGAD